MAENELNQTPPAEEKKTIAVPVDQLQQLLDQNKVLLENQDKMQKEMGILRESVNQNKLDEVENKHKPKELPKAFLKVYNGKIVTGWKSASNKLVYSPTNPNLVIGEVLQTVLVFADGSDSGPINQQDLTRTEDRVWVRVQSVQDLMSEAVKTVKVRAEKLETASEELRLSFQLPTEELEVEKKFLNP
jgi:hypothetical protein